MGGGQQKIGIFWRGGHKKFGAEWAEKVGNKKFRRRVKKNDVDFEKYTPPPDEVNDQSLSWSTRSTWSLEYNEQVFAGA